MSDETTPQTPDEPVEGAPTPQPPQTGLDIEVEHYVLPEGAADKVEPVDLESEMKRSYLDYAMAVIVGRALPDVRDGLKPVHRRVLYAMYDGGYRPDRAFNKSARVVGDVMGNYHPHGDTAIYDALVRLIQDWVQRYPLALGQGNFGSPGNDGAAAQRYTETKMAPLAMEMVRDIDEDTVDMQDNYDGKQQEPVVLPARYPNLLVNGSSGIAVGMATNIPPHNMREVAAGVQWYLEHPGASREELLEALLARVHGPDFPTGAQILGRKGIEEVYRTGRGPITMRAVVNVEEIQGRTCLVVTELPYMTNPDNLAAKIAEMVRDGKISGIADMRDETSGRTGQRLVIVLKRDAVAKVVLNNLYKHTELQSNFSANMLALVDGVPRTLSLDGFVHHWVKHQIDVIVRRTAFRKRKAEERAHILRGLLKALDMLDEVIATIRRSASADVAREALKELLDIDDVQAQAILQRAGCRFAARGERLAQAAQFAARMRRAQRVQGEKPVERAAVIARKILAELHEDLAFHRIGPVAATHEARRGGDHRQRADLRLGGRCMQCEQAAQRPAHPDRRRRGRGDCGHHVRQGQRRSVVVAEAMPGQVHQMQLVVRCQALHQGCEHTAMQCPAVQKNQCRPVADDVDMHARSVADHACWVR